MVIQLPHMALARKKVGGLTDYYDEIFIPASEMVADKTVPPQAITRAATTLKGAHYDLWAFDDAADEAIYANWMVPEDMASGANTFSVRVYWETPTTVGTEGVNWDVAMISRADGENIDVTPSRAYTETESLADGGAARDLNILTMKYSGSLFTNAGEYMIFSVRRDVDGTHDDLTDDANFIGLGIQWHALGASNAQWS